MTFSVTHNNIIIQEQKIIIVDIAIHETGQQDNSWMKER